MSTSTPMPRLSDELTGPVDPEHCQSCGFDADLTRWREHDDRDQPESIVVVLCRRCADRLIEPHPRLYAALADAEPHTGSMRICIPCRYRDGVLCAHPSAKANGGPGVVLTIAKPTRMHILRSPRRLSGWMTMWPREASACAQREIQASVATGAK